jgi:hypothetical protein
VKISRVKVITIEPSADALSMGKVVGLFSTAFEQVCALKLVGKFVVNSLTHELMVAEVAAVLEKLERLLKVFLSDDGSQFEEQWKEWCCECRV